MLRTSSKVACSEPVQKLHAPNQFKNCMLRTSLKVACFEPVQKLHATNQFRSFMLRTSSKVSCFKPVQKLHASNQFKSCMLQNSSKVFSGVVLTRTNPATVPIVCSCISAFYPAEFIGGENFSVSKPLDTCVLNFKL